MTVYLDILLFVNIAVNTAILWVSARFLKQNPSPLRFLAALSVCCIYGLAVCFPSLGILMNIFLKYSLLVS